MFNYINYNQNPDYYPKDEDGFLNPPVESVKDISPLNLLILNEIVKESSNIYRDILVAVYFRGSQLLNERAAESDFDVVIVLNEQCNFDSDAISMRFDNKLKSRFPYITRFDALVITEDELQAHRRLQFIVKVLSIRIFGQAIEDRYLGFKTDVLLRFTLETLSQRFLIAKEIFYNIQPNSIQLIVNHILKLLIRSAFELVIPLEMTYTRNLNLCQQNFVKYYPEYADISKKLLDNFNSLNQNRISFLNDASIFFNFLTTEYLNLKSNGK